MRLLVGADSAEPIGGNTRVAFEVAAGLSQRGHQVDLAYRNPGALLEPYRQSFRNVRRVRGWYVQPRVAARSSVSVVLAVRTATRDPHDAVYVHWLGHAFWGGLVASLQRVPLVCHLHGLPGRMGLQSAWARGRVDRYVAVSHHVAQVWAGTGVDPGRVTVVHNGVDVDEYSPGDSDKTALGLGPDQRVVLYAGRVSPTKGIHVLLEAWALLGLAPTDAALVIAGLPREEEQDAGGRSYLDRLHRATTGAVHWVRRQVDIVPWYRAADVVVVPSLWAEPFGRVVIEALACARPVVASRVGGIPEILTGGLAELLVEPDDAGQLARRIRDLIDWREHSPELGDQCRRHVKRDFSLGQMLDGVEAVLTA
ncbi:MAG: glycosyltransferase family 4 protein [Actinomycetota bacterium]|nr:glycosyltransferase family 4 protein [Actinomycetota bacterium]